MIDYDAVLGELHLEADRIQSAITALTALANRQEAAPVPTPPARPSVHLMPERATKARKNGQRKAAEGRGAWKAKAEAMLRAGKSIEAVAQASGVSKASVYALNGSLGLAPRGKGPKAGKRKHPDTPTKFRCQDCGQTGTDPVRCDHCQEKRAA
jgi:hypothetical protein